MVGFDSRSEIEDRISEIEDRSMKNFQTEALKFFKKGGKGAKREITEQNITDVGHGQIYIIGV